MKRVVAIGGPSLRPYREGGAFENLALAGRMPAERSTPPSRTHVVCNKCHYYEDLSILDF
jgi:hypothetical protein